jgi:hypothetical protein
LMDARFIGPHNKAVVVVFQDDQFEHPRHSANEVFRNCSASGRTAPLPLRCAGERRRLRGVDRGDALGESCAVTPPPPDGVCTGIGGHGKPGE